MRRSQQARGEEWDELPAEEFVEAHSDELPAEGFVEAYPDESPARRPGLNRRPTPGSR